MENLGAYGVPRSRYSGKTLGIIGMGRIGYNVAKTMHHGFGMKIIYHSRKSKTKAEKNFQLQKYL